MVQGTVFVRPTPIIPPFLSENIQGVLVAIHRGVFKFELGLKRMESFVESRLFLLLIDRLALCVESDGRGVRFCAYSRSKLGETVAPVPFYPVVRELVRKLFSLRLSCFETRVGWLRKRALKAA